MTGTGQIEQDPRGRSKVIFNLPRSSDIDQQEQLPSKQEEIVGRLCEASVASDVSGLTDGEFFRTEDVSSPSVKSSSNKIFRTVVRAPEPPAVSSSRSKLADIESETTDTTVSSSHDEKLSKKKRSVSFSDVQVRNYERVVEVNPSVTSGPAIGLGWNYSPDDDMIIPLDNFEDTREYSRRQTTLELALSRDKREALLRSWGYTQREIACSVRTILRSKNQRKQTIQNLHAAQYEEFVEKATRKMKHVFLFPLNKKAKKINVYPPAKNFGSRTMQKASLVDPSAA